MLQIKKDIVWSINHEVGVFKAEVVVIKDLKTYLRFLKEKWPDGFLLQYDPSIEGDYLVKSLREAKNPCRNNGPVMGKCTR